MRSVTILFLVVNKCVKKFTQRTKPHSSHRVQEQDYVDTTKKDVTCVRT